ncbi:NUDIX hydrolase N-terminal domain-containing protein [Bifidobacterium pluvialisilvae]|uniref:NUDIX hydrolase N-terminal domain-containing protein n=1 Tax=Bifidobacterium pluvialisilvae TaxID=2834436 RepID=UPI001F4137A2|nr:NUDIX hydrolase N-terminal domain-containing protein [Bifidobacterium pluvialisilvae]
MEKELQSLAWTGLVYCLDPFDRERYERIRDEDALPNPSQTRNTEEQMAMCFADYRDSDWTTLFE